MKKDIQLISVKKEDLELIRSWRNSPEVSAYMYTDKSITKEEQEAWYEKMRNDTSSRYWIIQYEEKKLGLASLTGISQTFNSCYWAFYLGDMSVRGGGIGAKVEYNVLAYVFEELKLNKIRCEVFAFNDKVIKMHEKFGFRREAYYRQHSLKNGKYEDVVGLALLRSEWEQLQSTLKTKVYGG